MANKKLYFIFKIILIFSPLSFSTDLIQALKKSEIQKFKKLLKKEAFLDVKDEKGTPLVQIALEKRNLELVYDLLEKGANPNLKNKKNQALIHRVDIYQKKTTEPLIDAKLLKFMLEKGADPNLTNSFARNAARLHFSDPKKIKLLMDYGADFEMKAFNGETGLLMLENRLKRLKNELKDLSYEKKKYSSLTNLIFFIKKPSYKKDLKKKIKELEDLMNKIKAHQKKLD